MFLNAGRECKDCKEPLDSTYVHNLWFIYRFYRSGNEFPNILPNVQGIEMF